MRMGFSPPSADGMHAALSRARDVLRHAKEKQERQKEERRRRLDEEEEDRRKALEKLNEEKERRKREKAEASWTLYNQALVETGAHAVSPFGCQPMHPSAPSPAFQPVSSSDLKGGEASHPWNRFRESALLESEERPPLESKYACEDPPPAHPSSSSSSSSHAYVDTNSSSRRQFPSDISKKHEPQRWKSPPLAPTSDLKVSKVLDLRDARRNSPPAAPLSPRSRRSLSSERRFSSSLLLKDRDGGRFSFPSASASASENAVFEEPRGDRGDRLPRFQGRLPLGPNFAKEEWKAFLNWQTLRMQGRAAVPFDPGRIWTEERALSPTRWKVAASAAPSMKTQDEQNLKTRNGADFEETLDADKHRDQVRHAQMTEKEIANERAWREKLQAAEGLLKTTSTKASKKRKPRSSSSSSTDSSSTDSSSNSNDEEGPLKNAKRGTSLLNAKVPLRVKDEEQDAAAEEEKRQRKGVFQDMNQSNKPSDAERARALADALEIPEFSESKSFEGSRLGTVFKNGSKGLGYYVDEASLLSLFAQTNSENAAEVKWRLKARGESVTETKRQSLCSPAMAIIERNSISSVSRPRKKSKKEKKEKKKQKKKKKHKKDKKKRRRRHSSESESDSEAPSSGAVSTHVSLPVGGSQPLKPQRPNVAVLEAALAEQQAAIAAASEASSSEDETAGPRPMEVTSKLASKNVDYGFALRPGEGEAIAQFVQEGKRIPRRGEVGLTADEIAAFENLGYVMSGSRHRRMNAIRIRKENQVYSAEEQRALAMLNYEERAARETQLIADLREMLKKQNEALFSEEVEEAT